MEARNQRTSTQLTLLFCGRTVRSSHRRCSIKKAVLRNFAIYLGKTCVGVSFLKSCSLKACNFIKERPQRRCFPVNIAKLLRISILKNIDSFNGSMLHEPKGSRSKLYDGVRLQGPSHRSNFLSRHSSS